MNKLYHYISLVSFIFLAACSSHQVMYSEDNKIPLNELANHLPAADSIESTLIFNAILDYGDEGIIQLCKQLESENIQYQIQARWALNGLALYVSARGKERQRGIYVLGLNKALDLSLNSDNKTFLMSQFQIVGGNESVPALSQYIDDPILFEPAIQILVDIGSDISGEALLNALPTSTGKQKVSLIRALGTIQYDPACESIVLLLNDTNISIQKSSTYALSNIGYDQARIPLATLVQKDRMFISSYLRLAERLGKNGNVKTCISICNEILENENDVYSENHRINALRLQATYNPDGFKNDIYKILAENNKRMRIQALELVCNYGPPELVTELVTSALDKSADVQLDIVEILGSEKSEPVNLFLRESLKSPSIDVRISALKSLSELYDIEDFPEILMVLGDSLDENEKKQIQDILLSNADSSEIDYLMSHFNNYSVTSKIVLLNILTLRRYTTYQSVILEAFNTGNPLLRLSALRALQICGDDNSLDRILSYLLNSEDEIELNAAIQAISSIINRSQYRNNHINRIKTLYVKSSNDKKILLFNVFKNVGGNELMTILVDETRSKDERIREAAFYNLSEWSDPNALNTLINIGQNNQLERTRIRALRGALRILQESPMGEQRALSYYKEIMNVVTRPEEKRLILAGLAGIRTGSSLSLISTYLPDPEINHEAFMAALAVVSESEGESLSREEIVISLFENQPDKELAEKIKIFTQEQIRKPIPPEGFTALFNGITLNGWKGLVKDPLNRARMSTDELRLAQIEADKLMNEHWHVIDGILYFDGKGSHLCTVNDYTDYELLVDWKIEKEGDSGIYLRGSPQVQIWDPIQWPEGSGGLYNNENHQNKPLQKADNPIGEWNTFHIIQQGEKVTVYLNDILVVDNVVMENFWERDKSIYTSGQIELQSHNTPLYFKNIFIRELEPEKPLFHGALFNGIDLNGWQVVGNSPESWHIKDKILYTEGEGGGWISTINEYADFELSLEYKVPEGGNSGVFLRSPHRGDPAYTGLEIQILDDYSEKYADLKKWQYTGSIYGLEAPSQRASKKSGEWQNLEIICKGPLIKITLNNILIVDAYLIDYTQLENEHPGLKRRKGYIGLQNHSTKIEFRNIMIRELSN